MAARHRAGTMAAPLSRERFPMKRILLFLLTNIAIMAVLSIVLRIFGLDRAVTSSTGTSYGTLLAFSAVVGFTGAIISLLLSKSMAKWTMGLTLIEQPRNESEAWVVETVRRLANEANVGMPEVGIYEGAPNAFATGAFKNSALVAVSTGLLQSMNKQEVEAVLAHEMAHVANGDMVTLALIQGVVNTFVVFASRVVGAIVDRAIFRTERGTGPGYFITVMVLQVVFGVLASIIVAWFSRHREFRADAGSARLLGSPQPMVNALKRLGGLEPGAMPKVLNGFGIVDKSAVIALFATHPPIEERIAALTAAAQQR